MTVFFQGFALATGVGTAAAFGSYFTDSDPFGDDGESVMVVIVGDDARVARIRGAVEPERLLVDEAGGFAMRGGRVIAASADSAGPILTSAGWIDARLDIFAPGSMGQSYGARTASSETSSRIRELMNKPELSLIEARELLVWMETNP